MTKPSNCTCGSDNLTMHDARTTYFDTDGSFTTIRVWIECTKCGRRGPWADNALTANEKWEGSIHA